MAGARAHAGIRADEGFPVRTARAGKERHVVKLMNQGRRDDAIAYMKKNGIIQAFEGAPEWKPVSEPQPQPQPIQSSPDEYRYPEFKPVREPLPEGVRWARIRRELAHELQKVIVFEEDEHLPEHKRRQALLWMALREQDMAKRRGRLIGQEVPVEENPEERQGGYRLWRR